MSNETTLLQYITAAVSWWMWVGFFIHTAMWMNTESLAEVKVGLSARQQCSTSESRWQRNLNMYEIIFKNRHFRSMYSDCIGSLVYRPIAEQRSALSTYYIGLHIYW